MKRLTYMAAVFAFLIGVTISFDACKKEDNSISNKSTMTDQRDGKVYKTVALGGKTWMAENLNYDTGNGLWVYDNDPSNANTYGRLYDWVTANSICPDGWHLPSYTEWDQLIDFLDGENVAGGKMKEEGTAHWFSPNTGATNSSGFTGLPGGNYSQYGFQGINGYGYFWSSTQPAGIAKRVYTLHSDQNLIGTGSISETGVGASVRCVKD